MIYNFFTSILVMIGFFQIYGQYKLGFFKGTAVLIIFLVVLDIICTIIEVSVPKIRDKYFYNKLMKRDKRETEKEKKRREEEEIKKAAEELQKMTQTPYYKNVSEAETFVNSLKEISDDNNFGENDQKIEFCVNRLNEIIELLKKNPSYYNRVAFLFEVYLPEFYNVLKQYTDFMEADCEDEELKQILTKSVDKFLKFLNSQKIETRLGTDKKQAKIQFKATAESLGDMVDRGEEND